MKKIITLMVSTLALATVFQGSTVAQSLDKFIAFRDMKPEQVLNYFEPASGDKESGRSTKDMLKDAKANLKTSKASLNELKATIRSAENFKY